MPDESTILRFRHLLDKHDLAVAIFAEANAVLSEKGLSMKRGTVVDATLIAAPSSTKNEDKKRDPEMTQTKKGNQCQWQPKFPHRRCGRFLGLPSGVVHVFIRGSTSSSSALHQAGQASWLDHPPAWLSNQECAQILVSGL
jgi:IS5 family transposase